MPPQRRKIVPPNTTSKARKKVAGSNRPPSGEPAHVQDSAIHEASPAANASGVGPSGGTEAADTTSPATPKVSTAKAEKADPAEPVDAPKVGAVTTSKRTNWKPVIVVGIVAVVLAAFAVVAAFRPGATIDNQAWVDQGATSEATRAATDAVVTLYSYKDTTIDEDFDRARTYLNPQMLSDFNEAAETTKSAVQQTRTATEASLTDIGVTILEDDMAELVANLNVSATREGVAQGNAEGPITINLEKVDGKWLLSALSDK
ncbi:hypothetical protein E5720_14325 [Rhodococcus sp. PAMC28707]|uniref:hypothetical protein n=1 Tax=unclassified Rhodococcus (in: high G+C Gram-positive bacteria) TaxID=192944 RepID=UPI00109DEAB4|nr:MULTISPECIES: hypothetical protein [unclassified Rhodococcus (in: high G+C Gram-positive bacteria)]QCB52339.1 hypothetical protein E5769_21195 [Rhodococcus sp. PAMC28705]QCB59491.1 hypothetical protein E5720_14325 [Rhodococcus sp. PAMC28707]